MNKAECRKYAGEPLRIRANSGLLCADQIEWLTTARVRVIGHRRILVLQVYSRARAAQGDLLPKWTVFQQKDDYLTLERREDGTASWRTACFERLSPNWNFVSRCAFLTQTDRKCISRFFHDDTQDGFGCLTAHQKLIQEDRQKARQRKERRRINARMQAVPPVPRGLKRWLYRKIMPAYFFYDAVKGRKTVPGVCSACGREISLSGVRYNGNALCPSCGRELIMKSRGRMGKLTDQETCQVIQRTAPDEVVVRVFKATLHHANQNLDLWEAARQFIRQKPGGSLEADQYYSSFGVWKAGTRPVFSRWQYNFAADVCGYVYPGNLPDALRDTPWQYCPVTQFCGYFQEPVELRPLLTSYITQPKIEHLVKVGFCDLVSDILYRYPTLCLDWEQNRTHRLLRVGAEDVPFLRNMRIRASSLTDFQAYCRMGLKDRQALFLWQNRHGIHYIERNILPFMAVTTPHRFMRYVDGQTRRLTTRTDLDRRYQNTYDVVREYADYLDLCRKLEFPLSDSVLFPRDLQKAHDRAAAQWKQELDAKMRRDFHAAMESIRLHADFELDGMVVLCPQSPEDIIQEGQALHHCVGTYVDRVAKQECVILFLRRAAEADKPFYTLEIRNRKVVQARSANNRPATPKVQRFLDQWEREVLQAA